MLAKQVLDEAMRRFPKQRFDSLTANEIEEFSSLLSVLADMYGLDAKGLVDCYETSMADILEETLFFHQTGRYRCSTFEEADEYMRAKGSHYMRTYQFGLLQSLFMWESHSQMRRRFESVTKHWSGDRYLEVGVGHGYYFTLAMLNSNFESYLGVDLNKDSIQMATSIVKSKNFELANKNYKLEVMDFFNLTGTYDAIVSGEVLEHVEDPGKFLRKFAQLSHDKTKIYVTTVINAPVIDHIYLFESPDEIRELFSQSGLKITDERIFLYRGKPLDVCLRKKYPLTVLIEAAIS